MPVLTSLDGNRWIGAYDFQPERWFYPQSDRKTLDYMRYAYPLILDAIDECDPMVDLSPFSYGQIEDTNERGDAFAKQTLLWNDQEIGELIIETYEENAFIPTVTFRPIVATQIGQDNFLPRFANDPMYSEERKKMIAETRHDILKHITENIIGHYEGPNALLTEPAKQPKQMIGDIEVPQIPHYHRDVRDKGNYEEAYAAFEAAPRFFNNMSWQIRGNAALVRNQDPRTWRIYPRELQEFREGMRIVLRQYHAHRNLFDAYDFLYGKPELD